MIDPGPLVACRAIPSHRRISPAYQSCLPLAAKCDSNARSRAPIRTTAPSPIRDERDDLANGWRWHLTYFMSILKLGPEFPAQTSLSSGCDWMLN